MGQTSQYRCAIWPTPVDDVSRSRDAAGNITYEIRGRTWYLVIILNRMLESDIPSEEATYIASRQNGMLTQLYCAALPTAPDGATFESEDPACPALSEFLLTGAKKQNAFGVEGLKIAFDYYIYFEAYVPNI